MPASLTEQFARALSFVMGLEGSEPGTVEVLVKGPGGQTQFKVEAAGGGGGLPPAAPPKRDPRVPEGALWLSELEEQVVEVVAGASGWVPAAAISQALHNDTLTHEFKAVLANLVERRILTSKGSKGYTLAGRDPAGLSGLNGAG